jgi:osmotically-inducible protein OsmY
MDNQSSMEPAEELVQRVSGSLEAKGPVMRGVRVEVSDGETVRLTGTLPTYHLRQVAVSVARRVAGVRHVKDRIQVTG